MLVATTDLRTARIYQLNSDNRWQHLSEQSETSPGAVIYDPSFKIHKGKPIITWEEFRPR